MDAFLFMKYAPKLDDSFFKNRVYLPEKSAQFKYTLVLDLDETLVHCSVGELTNPDKVFKVQFSGLCMQCLILCFFVCVYFCECILQCDILQHSSNKK